MSEKAEDLELFHHGVKGMKWGVRRDNDGAGQQASTKKIAKLDKKFEKGANSTETFVKVYNGAAQRANDEIIPKINSKPEYKAAADRGDLVKDTPVSRKYEKEYQTEFLKALESSASSLGTNASGTKKYSISSDDSGNWRVSLQDVKHASEDEFTVVPKRNAKGEIVGISLKQDSLEHATAEDLELFHHGVKGMKWGVRRSPSAKAQLKAERDKKIESATKKFDKAEADDYDAYSKVRAANRAAGQGRIKAGRNAIKAVEKGDGAKRMKDAENEVRKADKDYKQGLKDIKTNRKETRNAMRENAKSDRKTLSKGQKAAEIILLGGLPIGYQSAKSSGATTGQALVATYLAGPAAGVAYRRVVTR